MCPEKVGARAYNRQLGVLWPLWLLTQQEAARESTDSGQPIRAQGAWSTLRLTSSLSVTLLTSAGPHDGKYEEPGATSTLRPPTSLSLASFVSPPQLLPPNPGAWPQGLQTHAASVQRPTTWLFYCRADAKSCTQKNNELAHTHSLHRAASLTFPCSLLWLGSRWRSNGASIQVLWIVNGFQINWRDLWGSEIILRHCNEVGLPWTLMWLGFGYNVLEQNTINEEW